TADIPDFVERYIEETYLPERVVQFGEGNFLRGFVDWMIHQLNKKGLFNGKVVAIQPTPHGKVVPNLNAQNGLYTFVLQGIEEGKEVEKYEIISSISRGINPYENWHEVLKLAESEDLEFVFSNTTEAGLIYINESFNINQSPISYPGKLAVFLYHRFLKMNGDPYKGLTIIPCELVENNGDLLKSLVIKYSNAWNLGEDFMAWVNQHIRFCTTLVDRIVPGYPKKNIDHFQNVLGYEDNLIGVGEPYHLFAIEGNETIMENIPFHKAELNVKWGDVTPYRQLKVSLLNAPHTLLFSVGFLSGLNTVFEVMEDKNVSEFVKKVIFEEILPVVSFDAKEKTDFAHSVIERFSNRFVEHFLGDIGLNAISKFKTRVLPILLDWIKRDNRIPSLLSFSMAALFYYYRPTRVIDDEHMIGNRAGGEYKIRDSKEAVSAFSGVWVAYDENRLGLEQLVGKVLENEALWGFNLANIAGLSEIIFGHLESILQIGISESLSSLL
ncbi:MAG: tagaturonate reductase, partial [Bacillus sp. (in: firmicutes)]